MLEIVHENEFIKLQFIFNISGSQNSDCQKNYAQIEKKNLLALTTIIYI